MVRSRREELLLIAASQGHGCCGLGGRLETHLMLMTKVISGKLHNV